MELYPIKPLKNALWERLQELEDSGDFPGEMTVKALVARLFFATCQSTITRLHPQLTLHDLRHGEAVACHAAQIAKEARLLNPQNEYSLNLEEIYFLLAACFLHDIGMGVVNEREDHQEATKRRVSINEIVRSHHHERSEQFVRSHAKELYLDDRQSRILGLLCRAHRMSEILGQKPYHNQPGVFGVTIRLPLLSAILRVADEIDLDYSRAPVQVRDLWDVIGWFDKVSKLHWLKHYHTLGTSIEAITSGPELVIHPKITVRVPQGTDRKYYLKKVCSLIQNHLGPEIESVRMVTTPGFSFGDALIDYEEQDDLSRRFLRRRDITVLLADDDLPYAEAAKANLETMYGKVHLANNALDAIAAVTLNPSNFHAGIIDLDMPGLTGQSEIETGIVLISNFSRVAVNMATVANTGHIEEKKKWEKRAYKAGAHVFRCKSVRSPNLEVKELQAAVEQALDQLGYQLD